ncbi:hypothetical protein EPN87_03015 [archaeon]|nr:MAG: hypothetical protein EPN87_03015 [archaeon]
MKTVVTLLHGNHPKTKKLKDRTIEIIKFLKQNGGKAEASQLEAKLGISRTDDPSMFYKPLAALKRWDLVQTHKTVIFDETGKKHFKTEYELTQNMFYHYIEKTLLEVVKSEIETA